MYKKCLIGKHIGNININLDINIRIYRVCSRQNPDSGHYKLAAPKLSAAGAHFFGEKNTFLENYS